MLIWYFAVFFINYVTFLHRKVLLPLYFICIAFSFFFSELEASLNNVHITTNNLQCLLSTCTFWKILQ